MTANASLKPHLSKKRILASSLILFFMLRSAAMPWAIEKTEAGSSIDHSYTPDRQLLEKEGRRLTPGITPESNPRLVKKDPAAKREDAFYLRYFRKGKETHQSPPLKTHGGTKIEDVFKLPTPMPETDTIDREIAALIHDLGAEPHRRQSAVEQLSALGAPAVPALQRALKDPYPPARLGALGALGSIRPPGLAETIMPLLADPVHELRSETIRVLGRLHHKPAFAKILSLTHDPNERVMQEACIALTRIDSSAAGPALIGVLQTGPVPAQRQAAEELSNFTEPGAVDALLKATTAADRDLRLIAIRSLGAIGDSAARSRLKILTADSDPHIRQEAQSALQLIQ